MKSGARDTPRKEHHRWGLSEMDAPQFIQGMNEAADLQRAQQSAAPKYTAPQPGAWHSQRPCKELATPHAGHGSSALKRRAVQTSQRMNRITAITPIHVPYRAYSGSVTTRTTEPTVLFPSAMVVTRSPWDAGCDEVAGLRGACRRPR
jgi:hypothetical protein